MLGLPACLACLVACLACLPACLLSACLLACLLMPAAACLPSCCNVCGLARGNSPGAMPWGHCPGAMDPGAKAPGAMPSTLPLRCNLVEERMHDSSRVLDACWLHSSSEEMGAGCLLAPPWAQDACKLQPGSDERGAGCLLAPPCELQAATSGAPSPLGQGRWVSTWQRSGR